MANFGTYQGHLVLAEGFKNMATGINKAIERKHEKEMLESKQRHGTGSADNRKFNYLQEKDKEYKTLLNSAYQKYEVGNVFTTDADGNDVVNDKGVENINNQMNVDFIDEYMKNNPDSKLSFEDIQGAQKLTHQRVSEYIGDWQAKNTGEGDGFEFSDQDAFIQYAKTHPEFQGVVNRLQYKQGITSDDSSETPDADSLKPIEDRESHVKIDVKSNKDAHKDEVDPNNPNIVTKVNPYKGYSTDEMEVWKAKFKARNDKLNAEHRGFWTDDIDEFTITTDADDKWYIEDDDSAFWNPDRHTIKFDGKDGPYVTVKGVDYPLNTISHEQITKIF